MKHEAQQIQRAKSPDRQGIRDAFTGKHQIVNMKQKNEGFFNIFLIQNIGKGPPGRQRSPGTGIDLFPGHPPDAGTTPDRVLNPVGAEIVSEQTVKTRRLTEISINTEYQYFITTTKHNFLTIKFLLS
jgi:hypothetical protein